MIKNQDEMFDLVYFYYKKLHMSGEYRLTENFVSNDPKLQGKYHGAGRMFCKATGWKNTALWEKLHDRLLEEIKEDTERRVQLRAQSYDLDF